MLLSAGRGSGGGATAATSAGRFSHWAALKTPSGFSTMIFQDTFQGTSLNLTKWMPGIGAGGTLWNNSGRMGYDANGYAYCGQNTTNTSGAAVLVGGAYDSELYAYSQVTVNNGLTITCVPNSSNLAPGTGLIYPAISGAITTYNEPYSTNGTPTASTAAMALPSTGKWYVQLRAKLPDMSAGIGPNVYFLPGASGGNSNELDFIQGCFGLTNSNYYPFSTGYFVSGTDNSHTTPSVGVDVTQAFHIYGCEVNWDAGTITEYFDGTQVWSYTPSTLYAQNYMIIINIQAWVSGNGFTTGYASGTGSFQIAEVQAYTSA